MSKYVMAIDQGTTSTRCMIFNRDGLPVGLDQIAHRQIYPKPGWVEHDALEIWENTQKVIKQALSKAKLTKNDIIAIGIANQRETTVIWDRHTGKPRYKAIVWQDTRTDELCNRLAKEGGQDRFRESVGLPLSTYFSAPKIAWLLDFNQEIRRDAEKGNLLFGNIDSWITWNLTGGKEGGIHVTDVTNASRTMLMDLNSLEWDVDILKLFGIPTCILPRIMPSSHIYGEVKGFLNGVPVSGILGDQQAALFGQACFSPGEAKNTYGTGCFLLLNTGNTPIISSHGMLTTLAYQISDQLPVYCLEGSIAVTGALVQWIRDNLKMIESSSEIETLAKSVEDNGTIYIVPAFSGLFAPYWRSDARGVIVGLTRYINRGHIARAALESTAFQTLEVLEAMEQDSGVRLTGLKVDGGMVVNDLLMQFQADLLNVHVIRPKVAETTSLGAAYIAGLAVGYWKSLDELRSNWVIDKEWIPRMEKTNRASLYAGWKKAVTRTYGWIE